MVTECPYLRSVTKLAHQRGLLPKKQSLACEFEGKCSQVDCPKSEDPNFRPLFIKSSEISEEPSQKDKFYAKLEKHFQIEPEVRQERG